MISPGLYPIVYPLGLGAGVLAAPFSSKLRRGLLGRRGLMKRVRAHCAPWPPGAMWFHVASSGELEQVMPILEAVRLQEPRTKILLTFFSPTAARAIELERGRREGSGKALPWDYADYSPFDFGFSVEAFLDVVRPRAFVAIHREIWPGILEACRRRKIPSFLFAAYFPAAWGKRIRGWTPWLERFTFVGTTLEESAALVTNASARVKVEALGDPRIERVLMRKATARPAPWRGMFEGRKVFVGASLWEKDFTALAGAIPALLEGVRGLRYVLVPHEPKEGFVSRMIAFFKERGLPARRWSDWVKSPDLESHLVVDGVGFLAELYQVASVVLVGGSFQGRVHNVMEPASYGKPVLTGPFIWNSGEAGEMFAAGLLRKVGSPEDLTREALVLLRDSEQAQRMGEGLLAYLDARSGAGERYAKLLFT